MQELYLRLKQYMRGNQVEDTRRREVIDQQRNEIVEQQRTSKTKGEKRGAAGICDTVVPLISAADYQTAKEAVETAALNSSRTTAAYQDKDFKPYACSGLVTPLCAVCVHMRLVVSGGARHGRD